jgi:glycosyltransferase involved in cell wall biosynthesis
MMLAKKILLVAPSVIPTSKDSIAGSEQMIYVLGKSLSEMGNDVHTIAREDSEVYGNLISGGFKDFKFDSDAELDQFYQVMNYTASAVRKTIRDNPDLDAIIDRTCQGLSLSISHEEDGPKVISCLNMPSQYFLAPVFFNELKSKIREREDSFIAVSNHIAEEYKNKLNLKGLASRVHTIHNGIILDNFDFSSGKGDYLLYLGRITEDKAPHLAIQVARDTGHKIVVAGGIINENAQYQDEGYVAREIKPLLGSNVEWYGPANLKQKVELFKNAKAVIFPRQSYEPFGIVPIESMACGTPVIAFNHGGPAETIVDGKTGFLIESYLEMKEAVGKIGEIDRSECRKHVEDNFDYRLMGKKYFQLI